QIVVDVNETYTYETHQYLKLVYLHKVAQLHAHPLDRCLAKLHPPGTDLRRISAQQNELRRIATTFDPADPGQTASWKFAPNHRGDLHYHPQCNRADRFAGIASGSGETLDCRLGPKRVEIHSHHAPDRIDCA